MDVKQRGDQEMQLLDQMVKHSVSDIKELQTEQKEMQRSIVDLERKHIVTDNNVNQINSTLSSLQGEFRELREDWKNDKDKERKRYDKKQRSELDRYKHQETVAKNRWWGLVFLIIGGILLAFFGLK